MDAVPPIPCVGFIEHTRTSHDGSVRIDPLLTDDASQVLYEGGFITKKSDLALCLLVLTAVGGIISKMRLAFCGLVSTRYLFGYCCGYLVD